MRKLGGERQRSTGFRRIREGQGGGLIKCGARLLCTHMLLNLPVYLTHWNGQQRVISTRVGHSSSGHTG